jgi:hypothetical protein
MCTFGDSCTLHAIFLSLDVICTDLISEGLGADSALRAMMLTQHNNISNMVTIK